MFSLLYFNSKMHAVKQVHVALYAITDAFNYRAYQDLSTLDNKHFFKRINATTMAFNVTKDKVW